MQQLFSFEIIVDDATSELAFSKIPELARKHKLTSYDAAYLELAIRGGLPIATFDRALAEAATAKGVKLLITDKDR